MRKIPLRGEVIPTSDEVPIVVRSLGRFEVGVYVCQANFLLPLFRIHLTRKRGALLKIFNGPGDHSRL